MRVVILAVVVVVAAACSKSSDTGTTGSITLGTTGGAGAGSGSGTGSSGAATTGTATSSSGSTGTSGSTGSLAGVDVFTRMAGLWSGAAPTTPLGPFPLVNMDFRPEGDGHLLFGRVDLDDQNTLRFGWSIETVNGVDTVIFRNGGLFSGLPRDTRTQLVDTDSAAGTWHFCAEADGGCGYVDALFSLSTPDDLTLNVHVMGQQHEIWNAHRAETRDVPTPFPADLSSQGSGTADWPPMPELDVTVNFPALAADADVWVVLSTTDCNADGSGCTASRHLKAAVLAGATQAVLAIQQIHAGAYKATAVLDRNRDFEATEGPDHGDGVSFPNAAVTVAPTGTSAQTLTIVTSI